MIMNELTKAKIELYSKLLSIANVDDLSDSDVDLMYLLSKDKDVQNYLASKINHG